MYRRQKIHKAGAPVSLGGNTIGAPTYRLDQNLAKLLGQQVWHSPRQVKNSIEST
jgi:hypothetical protein